MLSHGLGVPRGNRSPVRHRSGNPTGLPETQLTRGQGGEGPLVIVLDDLHWADKPTLLLLQHLSRELANLRVLVIGTFRDTDLSRTHPLSDALASLNRETGFQRVVLKGLAKAEVAAYIREAANAVAQPALIDKIFEETEGNPFFLSEVVNLLTQEGAFSKQSISDIAVPDGVKEALGRRLDRISAETNELLQVCAVAGREFSYDTLTLLDAPVAAPLSGRVGVDPTQAARDDALLRMIEEALAARVIEEMDQPGRYRFTHALMQETLLSELSTTRRVRLHGQVGEALERRWGDRAPEFASRLATHFLESSTLTTAHADKAINYAVVAAEHAESGTGWDEAAKHYGNCLKLLSEAGDENGGREPDLLVRFGRCTSLAGDYRAAWRALMRARELYRPVADWRGFASATLAASRILAPPQTLAALLDEAAKLLGDSDPELEASLLLRRIPSMNPAESGIAVARARELATEHGLASVLATLRQFDAQTALRAGHQMEAQSLFAEAFNDQMMVGDVSSAAGIKFILALIALRSDPLPEAESKALDALAFARKYHVDLWELNILIRLTGLYTARGNLAQFESLASSYQKETFCIDLHRAYHAECAGRMDEAVGFLPGPEQAGNYPMFQVQLHSGRTRILFRAGETEAARTELATTLKALDESRRSHPTDIDSVMLYMLCELDDALTELTDRDTAAALYEATSSMTANWDPVHPRSFARVRAQLALSLGLVDEAAQRYEAALAWCEGEHLGIETGRCLQGLAAVAERRGDGAVALTYLDRAASLFRPRGVKLHLDEVIAAKVRLLGVSDSIRTAIDSVAATVRAEHPDLSTDAAADGTVTLLFSDIEGSTPLNNRLGDAKWLELLHAHNAVLDAAIQAHGGRTVKTMGDGYMVAFPSPTAAVRCAVGVQAKFREPPAEFRVRIGVHVGAAVRDGSDFFGREVNYAARVASAALGGEVLVSEAVHERLGTTVPCDDGQEVEMKGFAGLHRVYRVIA